MDLRAPDLTTITPHAGPPPRRTMREDLAEAQRSFASVLGRAAGAPDAGDRPEARAREAAEQLVAHTFLVPMLKELRASDRTAPPFAPSQGEKQFRALLDAELAQRLVKAGRFPLIDRLARDLLKSAAPGAPPTAAGPSAHHPAATSPPAIQAGSRP